MALVTTDPSFCFILQSHICTSGVRGPPSHHSEGGFAAKRRPRGRGEAQCRCPRFAEMASGGRALPTARHRQAPLGPVGTVWCGTVP